MKTIRIACVGLSLLALQAAQRPAFAVVGYVNYEFEPGANFFGNPLDPIDSHLNLVIPSPPSGTSVALWNSLTLQYDPIATFTGGLWDNPTLLLAPGTGARLLTSSTFTNTFVGEVLNYDGSPSTGPIVPAPPFGGPDGLYLWNSKYPIGGDHSGLLFDRVVGRAPNDGESFWRFDPGSQSFVQTTFLLGSWDDGNPMTLDDDPFLNVGEAGFFDIGGTGMIPTVPEPAGLIMIGLGLMGFLAIKRIRS